MNYINVSQRCYFCKKGSHVFKVMLDCFDDESGEVIIDSIKTMECSFKCDFCLKTLVLNFKLSCPPSCILQLKDELKENKKKMNQLIEQLTSSIFLIKK